MASLGAGIMSDHAGPVMYNSLSFDYGYLVRLGRRAFISLGLRGGVDHLNVSLHDLQVIDFEDPSFQSNIKNEFRPSFGGGFVFYTPLAFLGVFVPHWSLSNLPWNNEIVQDFANQKEIIINGGLDFGISHDLKMKLSGLQRFMAGRHQSTDMGVRIRHSEGIMAGVNYRTTGVGGVILGLPVSEKIRVMYAFETPLNFDPVVNRGIHELSVSFDFTRLRIPNRNRRFQSRKKAEEEKEMNSIRYFNIITKIIFSGEGNNFYFQISHFWKA